MNDSFSNYDQSTSGPANNSKASPSVKGLASEPRPIPAWLKQGAEKVAVQAVAGIGWFCLLSCAVIFGTALGNGVPMARSATAAFNSGFTAGLRASVPRPIAAGQKLVINPVPEPDAPGRKSVTPSPIKTALLETLEAEPVSRNPKAFEVKESVIRSKVSDPSKVFETK
jgi:hypothetical protein